VSDEESLSERLARQARDLMETAGSKGGRLARAGRLQLDVLGIRRDVQQELRRLGERTLELVRQGGAASVQEDPAAGAILRRIEQLEADRTQREAQILKLREKSSDAGGS
jgi:hypothetical protein